MSKPADKMKKVRAAKKAPTYKNVHQDVPRDDENYLCLKFVKEWQKHNKDRVKELKYLIRKGRGGPQKELRPLERELQNRQTYVNNLARYLDTGIWMDLFYGKDQESLMKFRTVARAYDSEGYIKTIIPAVG